MRTSSGSWDIAMQGSRMMCSDESTYLPRYLLALTAHGDSMHTVCNYLPRYVYLLSRSCIWGNKLYLYGRADGRVRHGIRNIRARTLDVLWNPGVDNKSTSTDGRSGVCGCPPGLACRGHLEHWLGWVAVGGWEAVSPRQLWSGAPTSAPGFAAISGPGWISATVQGESNPKWGGSVDRRCLRARARANFELCGFGGVSSAVCEGDPAFGFQGYCGGPRP